MIERKIERKIKFLEKLNFNQKQHTYVFVRVFNKSANNIFKSIIKTHINLYIYISIFLEIQKYISV